MFIWGIIINILLLIYMINKRDSLKVLYIYIASICVYYLFIYKVPLFSFKNILLNFDFISLILLTIIITILNTMVRVYENGRYYEEKLLDSLFNHLESKVLFIFTLSLFLMTNYFIINLILLIYIYKLFNIPKNISYISINLLLLLNLIKNPLIFGLLNNHASNYTLFMTNINILFLLFVIIEMIVLLLISFSIVKIDKNVPFNWYYVVLIFIYGLFSFFFYKDVGSDVVNFILLIIMFVGLKKVEDSDEAKYIREEKYPVLIPFLFVLLVIGYIREFFDFPVLMIISGLVFIYCFDRENKYSTFKKNNYKLIFNFILLIFVIIFFTELATVTLNNNAAFTGSFKDYYNDIITSTPNTIVKYIKSIFFSGYVFIGNIDTSFLRETMTDSYKVFFSVSTSFLLMIPLQALLIKTIDLKENIKENVFISYLLIIFSSIIIIYIAI